MTATPASLSAYHRGFTRSTEHLSLNSEVKTDPPGCVIHLGGGLDTEGAHIFEEYAKGIREFLEPGDTVSIDMEHLRYIASMGIGVLTMLMLNLQRSNIRMVLSNVPESVQRLFKMVGLLSYFEMDPPLESHNDEK